MRTYVPGGRGREVRPPSGFPKAMRPFMAHVYQPQASIKSHDEMCEASAEQISGSVPALDAGPGTTGPITR